jgi:hypothetical protein
VSQFEVSMCQFMGQVPDSIGQGPSAARLYVARNVVLLNPSSIVFVQQKGSLRLFTILCLMDGVHR